MLCTVGKSTLTVSSSSHSPPDDQEHMLHLFSPTTLKVDLSYVDKTYYEQITCNPTKESNHINTLEDGKQAKVSDTSQQSLHAMIFNHAVGLLTSMSHLDLRSLNLTALPDQISQLSHLTCLDLSHNKLSTLPLELHHLKHLCQLNLAHNQFTHMPPALSQLDRLTQLDLSHNPLYTISSSLSCSKRLETLDVSHTNIASLPAELAHLVVIRTENCPRMILSSVQYSLDHDPPSLLELCARQLLISHSHLPRPTRWFRRKTIIPPTPTLPDHLWDYMRDALPCSFCHTPCVQVVIRFRIIQRLDESLLPVHYRLCRAHWSDESDRLLSLFSCVF